MGTTTFSGPVVSNNGFVGAVTGNVTASTVTATTVSATGNVTADSGTAPVAGGMSAFLMSSTAGLGIYVGSGVPTVSAAQGSLYIRTDGSSTSTRLYVNTNGTTGWTNVTTAT
jgi:hypothetical protein